MKCQNLFSERKKIKMTIAEFLPSMLSCEPNLSYVELCNMPPIKRHGQPVY